MAKVILFDGKVVTHASVDGDASPLIYKDYTTDKLIIDGKEYRTVTIGNQTWMAQNLDLETDSGSIVSNRRSENEDYGRLYQWDKAVEVANSIEGWHLPTLEEWNTLANAVGGTDKASISLVSNKYENCTDDYGFGILLDGYYAWDEYTPEEMTSFWTQSPTQNEGSIHTIYIQNASEYSSNSIGTTIFPKTYFYFPIRLIKDNDYVDTNPFKYTNIKCIFNQDYLNGDSDLACIVTSENHPLVETNTFLVDENDFKYNFNDIIVGQYINGAYNPCIDISKIKILNPSLNSTTHTFKIQIETLDGEYKKITNSIQLKIKDYDFSLDGYWQNSYSYIDYIDTENLTFARYKIIAETESQIKKDVTYVYIYELTKINDYEYKFTDGYTEYTMKLIGKNELKIEHTYSDGTIYSNTYSRPYKEVVDISETITQMDITQIKMDHNKILFKTNLSDDIVENRGDYQHTLDSDYNNYFYLKIEEENGNVYIDEYSLNQSSIFYNSTINTHLNQNHKITLCFGNYNLKDYERYECPIDFYFNSLTIGDKEYKTITIGNQTWMAENLDLETETGSIKHDIDGYGRLYQWDKAIEIANSVPGWHLPSYEDWTILQNVLSIHPGNNGHKLKSSYGWNDYQGNNGSGNGDDNYNFKLLPAGYAQSNKIIYGIGSDSNLWISTEYNTDTSKSYATSFNMSAMLNIIDSVKTNYYSVRLIKDN